jgi:hypothetical protein
LRHGFQVGFSNVVSVLNGIHAGLNRIVHTIERHGVRCYFVVLAMRFIHDGAQLVERESRDVIQLRRGLDQGIFRFPVAPALRSGHSE